ncbi:MAG: hypothetical protein AAGF95_34965, partial [Chloroflexota bacterium]
AWNQPRAQYYTPIGYPTASPYNGGRMRYCPNRYFDSYGFVGTIGVACYMTRGASGSPWLTNFVVGSAGEMNYLNGTFVTWHPDFPNVIISEYIGDTAKSFYDTLY